RGGRGSRRAAGSRPAPARFAPSSMAAASCSRTAATSASPASRFRCRRRPGRPPRARKPRMAPPRPPGPRSNRSSPDRRSSCGAAATVADRYGRIPAYIYVLRDRGRRSAAHAMVGRGFARVSARVGDQASDRACAAELLARERAAREAKLGLWRGPYYVVMAADGSAELAAERGRFALVEGKVLSVRETAGTIYMNFGRPCPQALPVRILNRTGRSFAAAGLERKTLETRRVRVRGWVEDRNGPRIEASRPEQIEIAERS